MRARAWLRGLWALAGLAVALVLVRTFLADLYRVDSGSMRPTIFGGRARPEARDQDEWVVVAYRRDPRPERFDLVVLRPPDGQAPLVKRVVGLPGESLRIVDGDLVVNGRRLPTDHPRPPPIPVFDDRLQDVAEFFEYKRDAEGTSGPWHREDGVWYLHALGIPPGSQAGSMLFHPDLRDDYLDRQGRRQTGLRQVGDGVLACEFRLEQLLPDGVLRFRLVEEGDSFEAEVHPIDGRVRVRLVRWNAETLLALDPARKRPVVAVADVEVPLGRWLGARLANVDNHVTFTIPELDLELTHSYASNVPYPGRKPAGQKSLGHRVAFGGEGVRAAFRSVRVLRDLHYTGDGRFAVERPVTLGGDELFVLGDNSATSTDSRHFGPVSTHRLVGQPLAIVWPSFRWLTPTEAGE